MFPDIYEKQYLYSIWRGKRGQLDKILVQLERGDLDPNILARIVAVCDRCILFMRGACAVRFVMQDNAVSMNY